MVTITIWRNKDNAYCGFDCTGHAAFADQGQDIVCAGVSALVINTINSLATLTREKFSTDSDEEKGMISFRLENPGAHDAELLCASLVLGLQGIQNGYGDEYLQLTFKEV